MRFSSWVGSQPRSPPSACQADYRVRLCRIPSLVRCHELYEPPARRRDRLERLVPALGLVGTGVAIPIVLYHLYITDVKILLWILGIFISIFLLEVLYLERSPFNPDVESDG
jgi:hypothetical protein